MTTWKKTAPVEEYTDNYSRSYGTYRVRRCKLADWNPLVWPMYTSYTVTYIGRGILEEIDAEAYWAEVDGYDDEW